MPWRDLLPGVIVAAVFWQLLQHLGGFYIDHELRHTGPLYGVFALVLGLLAWLYLGAQLTIFAAEINVVRYHRLWPRSFFSDPLLDADRRALTSSAEVEERVQEENVEVELRRGRVDRPRLVQPATRPVIPRRIRGPGVLASPNQGPNLGSATAFQAWARKSLHMQPLRAILTTLS